MKNDNTPIAVTIRGKSYPSIAAAARAFKWPRDMVLYRVRHGRADEIGLEPYVPKPRPRKPTPERFGPWRRPSREVCAPIILDERVHDAIYRAAHDQGVSLNEIIGKCLTDAFLRGDQSKWVADPNQGRW